MKVAVVGSRDFMNQTLFDKMMGEIITKIGTPTEIISGGAAGADTLAEDYAKEKDIPTRIFRADWGRLGKKAGPLRNTDIINAAEVVVAFWNLESRGTMDSINKAIATGKRLFVVNTVQGKLQELDNL